MRKLLPLCVAILLVVAGFGFFFFKKTEIPRTTPENEKAPSLKTTSTNSLQPQSHVPDASAPTSPASPRVTLRQRMQSTYTPNAATKTEPAENKPAPAVAQAMRTVNPPAGNGRPAADFIAEFETDDHKSAFPNPVVALHQAVENETPDQDWSQSAAQQLADYLTATLGSRFEFPLIQCGQDICEIQAASFVSGNHADDERDFQRVFSAMPQQPWWTALQFDEQQLEVTGTKNGRVVFIGFVTRA